MPWRPIKSTWKTEEEEDIQFVSWVSECCCRWWWWLYIGGGSQRKSESDDNLARTFLAMSTNPAVPTSAKAPTTGSASLILLKTNAIITRVVIVVVVVVGKNIVWWMVNDRNNKARYRLACDEVFAVACVVTLKDTMIHTAVPSKRLSLTFSNYKLNSHSRNYSMKLN